MSTKVTVQENVTVSGVSTEAVTPEVLTSGTTSNNRIAEVNTNTYVLQTLSGAQFSGANGIPSWLSNALNDAIVDGTTDVNQLIVDLRTAFTNLETGVHQEINSVQTDILSTSTKLDSNISRLDGNVAGVLELTNSKVTPEEARATAITAVNAEFETPGTQANSILVDIISVQADAKGTAATEVSALQSEFNDTISGVQANVDVTSTRLSNAGIDEYGNLSSGGLIRDTIEASAGGTSANIREEMGLYVGTHIWNKIETLIIGMQMYSDLDPDGGNYAIADNAHTKLWTYYGGSFGWKLTSEDTAVTPSRLGMLLTSQGASIKILQSQIDGEISTYFGSLGVDVAPTDTDEPFATWLATDNTNGNVDEQLKHIGDLFYNNDDQVAYRFTYADIDDTPDAGVIFSWVLVSDTAITRALADAAKAQNTADGKATTYFTTKTLADAMVDGWASDDTAVDSTTNYMVDNVGDILIDSTNGKTYRFNGTTWVLFQDTDLHNTVEVAVADLSGLEETVDGEVVIFSGAIKPTTGMAYGDWWIDPTNTPSDAIWRYESVTLKNSDTTGETASDANSWRTATGRAIAEPILNSYNAGLLAKSKAVVFYQTTEPTTTTHPALDVGDMWVDTDSVSNVAKIWNGTEWEDISNTAADKAALLAQEALTNEGESYAPNRLFENWTGTYPDGFGHWNSVPIKETTLTRVGGKAVRLTAAANANSGMRISTDFKSESNKIAEDVVVSVDVYLVSGTFAGSGIIVDWESSSYRQLLNLYEELPNASTGRWYRVNKLFKRPSGVTNFNKIEGYIMGHWSGHNGGIGSANNIIFDRFNIREATDADRATVNNAKLFSGTTSQRGTTEEYGKFAKAGDLYVNTSEKYTGVGEKGYKVYKYTGSTWVVMTYADASSNSLTWAGGASSLLTDQKGSITGWDYKDGSDTSSEFRIHANHFKIVNSDWEDGDTVGVPFSVDRDAATGNTSISFNGKVNFGVSGQDMSSYDNSNVPGTNLIVPEYATFDATTISKMLSAGSLSTVTGGKVSNKSIRVENNDSGVLAKFKNYMSVVPTNTDITISVWVRSLNYTPDLKIYIYHHSPITINSSVAHTMVYGVWTLLSFNTNSGSSEFTIGVGSTDEGTFEWNSCMIERTNSNSPSTFNHPVADASLRNVTSIDGGKITTGTIDADRIFTDEIVINPNGSGVISNASSVGGSDYTMKVDFNAGFIYIQ